MFILFTILYIILAFACNPVTPPSLSTPLYLLFSSPLLLFPSPPLPLSPPLPPPPSPPPPLSAFSSPFFSLLPHPLPLLLLLFQDLGSPKYVTSKYGTAGEREPLIKDNSTMSSSLNAKLVRTNLGCLVPDPTPSHEEKWSVELFCPAHTFTIVSHSSVLHKTSSIKVWILE